MQHCFRFRRWRYDMMGQFPRVACALDCHLVSKYLSSSFFFLFPLICRFLSPLCLIDYLTLSLSVFRS